MKVALVEIWRHGGTAQYAAELARGLHHSKAENDTVHLIVPVNFFAASSDYQLHKVLPELMGGQIGGKIGSLITLHWLRSCQAALAIEEIKKIKPDVVHVLGTSAAGRGFFQQVRRIKAKSVVTVHDLPGRPGLQQYFFNRWSRHFTLADHIFVHGAWSKSQIEEKYGAEAAACTSVIPMGGYDYGRPTSSRRELREHYGLPQSAPVILFFGSLRRNKGLEVLLQALASERSHRAHVFVVGQRPSKSEPSIEWYQEMARKWGVQEKITWLIRYIEDAEVPNIFECADVVCLPYMNSFAGQSSVLSVAAVYGVPVLVSDIGDIGATVREYELGRCVEPESSAALSAAIGDIGVDDVVLGHSKTQQFAHDSSWVNIGRRLWTQYQMMM